MNNGNNGNRTDNRNSGYPRNRYYSEGNPRSSRRYSEADYPRSRNPRPSAGYSNSGNSRQSGRYPQNRKPRQSGGYSSNRSEYRKSSYRPPENDGEKLPVSVFIGIGVTAVAVIALIISISINSGKSKKPSTYINDSESNTDANSAAIVEISEDSDEYDEFDENSSSKLSAQSFVGTWSKTGVPEDQKATFTVTMQYDDSFEFRLEMWNDGKSAVITDTAFYTDETHAEFTPKKKKTIRFERGTDYVLITHTGSNSSFGIGDKFAIDGRFSETDPNNTTDTTTTTGTTTTTAAQKNTYDYNLYKSDAVVEALTKTLSSDDYALYKDMMKNGLKSPIDYERTTDKNGNLVNVDAELNAVKYYAHLNSSGSDMIFICSDNADIYVLLYNSEEIIYYTNDKNYSKKMPASFQAVAKAKDIKPIFK